MIVAKSDSDEYNIGRHWIGNRMKFTDFLRPDINSIELEIACGSNEPVVYNITSDCTWLGFSKTSGETSLKDIILISIDRSKLKGKEIGIFNVQDNAGAKVIITVEADNPDLSGFEPMTFIEYDSYICMESDNYYAKGSAQGAGFIKLSPYGRTGTGMKAFSMTIDFMDAKERPWLEYRFIADNDGMYNAEFHLAPSTPIGNE